MPIVLKDITYNINSVYFNLECEYEIYDYRLYNFSSLHANINNYCPCEHTILPTSIVNDNKAMLGKLVNCLNNSKSMEINTPEINHILNSKYKITSLRFESEPWSCLNNLYLNVEATHETF